MKRLDSITLNPESKTKIQNVLSSEQLSSSFPFFPFFLYIFLSSYSRSHSFLSFLFFPLILPILPSSFPFFPFFLYIFLSLYSRSHSFLSFLFFSPTGLILPILPFILRPPSLSSSTFSFLYIPVLIASYPSFSSLSSLPSFPSSCFLILPSSFPVIICNLFFSSNLTKEHINASQKFYFFNPYLVN